MIKRLILGVLFTIFFAWYPSLGRTGTYKAMAQSPTPNPDRLAEPTLSENPTQYEQGRHLYWLHCMACHGDMGQGLTDEFRSLWVDDHQNCWGRGCHGGQLDDEGFPIPATIPAIISSSGDLPKFVGSGELFEYLQATHPPQNPGYLLEDEYLAITAYVLTENNHLPLGKKFDPQAGITTLEKILVIAVIGPIPLIVSVIIIWIRWRRKALSPPSL